MSNKPISIGILGCGRISHSHAAAALAQPALTRLIAAADDDATRLSAFAERHGIARRVASLRELLALPELDAIVICTPNALHAGQAIEALRAGKHVLVEKPMAENAADAARMAAAAENSGRVLALGHTFRHSDAVRYVQDRCAEFGRLRAVEVSSCVHWDGPQAPWWAARTPREGLILSLFASHSLDFVQAIVGRDPLHVHCEAARFQTRWQGEDEAMILLRYPEGCLASIHVSYNQPFITDRKTLHFERALVRIENGQELWIDDRCIIGARVDDGDPHRMGQRKLNGFFECQLREFVAAVRGEPNRSVLHAEGVRLTALLDRVIEAGWRSAQN